MSASTIGIKIDEETRERVRRLGALKERSPHWIMKAAIREYLEREERRERERLEDAARWERFAETGAHHSHDDMLRWMDGLVKLADDRARLER